MMKQWLILMMCLSIAGLAWTQSQPIQTSGAGASEAYIIQTGHDLDGASIHQEGPGNYAIINQAGVAQDATGVGGWWDGTHFCEVPYFGGDNWRGIVQIGSNNNAYITQSGQSASSQAGIGQYSSLNDASIDQNPVGAVESHYIRQEGGTLNYAAHEASGGFNTGRTWQNGTENFATVYQTGHDNYAYQYQEGSNPESATITQIGNHNEADCDGADGLDYQTTINGCTTTLTSPTHATLGPGGQEYASQYQDGNGNGADTDVQGDFNNTTQYQDGHNNDADIDILGDGTGTPQLAKQVQLGNANSAVIDITGNSNIAASYQQGGHISTIILNGNNNKATAVQGTVW